MRPFSSFSAAVLGFVIVGTAPCLAVHEEQAAKARAMMDKAVVYLMSKQDEKTGGWSGPGAGEGRPVFPAVTGLALQGVLPNQGEGVSALKIGGVDPADPRAAKALAFMLSYAKPDGGIYDRILPSYNTAICLSALSRFDTPEARAAAGAAQGFLKKLQWSEASAPGVGGDEASKPVDKAHPYYGGIGYGRGGRPDGSNLNFMIDALHDSGVPSDDPAYARALVFLSRTQMHGRISDMEYAKGSAQGGFIYSTSPDKDHVGKGESKAGVIEETMDDGTKVSRLRAYGSMTYAGFKSYLYAKLDRADPRVVEAMGWIRHHYTLRENPGLGGDGLYYYFVTFAKAFDAWGAPTIAVPAGGGEETGAVSGAAGAVSRTADWADDLIDRLAELQNEDGSFKFMGDKWMEGDPVLITSYALIALRHATR